MQILMLGMHRSGTSLTTRLVNMMGAYFGPETSIGEITIDNPKGFWERPEIFKLNDAILATKNCSWEALQKWDPHQAHVTSPTMTRHIQKIVLGMDAFRPWVLKDPRMCLLLPVWRPYLEVPVAVIVHRNPVEIALSLERRDRLPPAYGLALWEYYAVGMLNSTFDMPRIFVQHSDMLEKPVEASEALFNALVKHGVRRLEMPTAREITAFIDPSLYRAKADSQPAITPAQVHLCNILAGKTPQSGPLTVSEHSDAIMHKGAHAAA